jgi:hypothetical protein
MPAPWRERDIARRAGRLTCHPRGENYGYRTLSGPGWPHVLGARGGPLGRPLLTSGHKQQDVPSLPGARFMYTHTHTQHTHTRLAQQGAILRCTWWIPLRLGQPVCRAKLDIQAFQSFRGFLAKELRQLGCVSFLNE